MQSAMHNHGHLHFNRKKRDYIYIYIYIYTCCWLFVVHSARDMQLHSKKSRSDTIESPHAVLTTQLQCILIGSGDSFALCVH